jgi:hypothetical protein
MPNPRMFAFVALGALTLAACNKKGSGPEIEAGPDVVAKIDAKDSGRLDNIAVDHRKVIRTGSVELVVASYDDARARLETLLEASGGYIDSTKVSRNSGTVSYATIVLRLPSKSFGSIIPRLRELGEVSNETTNAADITDQYVDISARIASAKVLEKRLLELVAERNGTVDSVLAVERELARVRGEIEGHEGRVRQWDDQIAMSTLTLSLETRDPEIASAGLGDRISDTFGGSMDMLRAFGAGLAVLAIALLPWLVILIPGLLVGRHLWRRHTARQLPPAVARPPVLPVA